jgi:hypothetical protein
MDIPTAHEGLLWIKTANNDKTNTSEEFLSFTVNQDVTAYVAYDHQISVPDWITSDYINTGDFIEVSDLGDGTSMEVWARDFPAGEVGMGGNMASGGSGAQLMYLVFLQGQGSGADTDPPIISQVETMGITDSTALIQWITDELSDSQVEYGFTATYGSMTPLDGSMVTQHSLALFGLLPETEYHYRVRSADGSANVAYSGDQTLQTEGVDLIPPQISSVGISSISDSGATISWITDEPANSQVEYGLAADDYEWAVQEAPLTMSHSIDLVELTAGTHYHFIVRSQDAAGNPSTSPDSVFTTQEEIPGQPGKPEHIDD